MNISEIKQPHQVESFFKKHNLRFTELRECDQYMESGLTFQESMRLILDEWWWGNKTQPSWHVPSELLAFQTTCKETGIVTAEYKSPHDVEIPNIEDYIQSQLATAEWIETEYNNYQLTDYQCHYNPATHSVMVEEVCVNQYGSMYGIGLYCIINLPKEVPAPDWAFGWTLIPVTQ